MSHTSYRARSVALVAVLALTAVACGSESAPIESADTPSTTVESTTTTADLTTAPAPTATTIAPPATEPVLSTTLEPVTTTTTTVLGEALAEYDMIEPLIDFGAGDSRFVRLSETPSLDEECSQGVLAVETEGEIVHIYDDVGSVGGLRADYGPFGQIAIVENCEEWTTRLLFASESVPPPDGIPIVNQLVPPSNIFHLDSLGWYGTTGWFSGEAAFYDGNTGWNDTVLFDYDAGTIEITSDVFGWRDPILDVGIDYVGAGSWLVPPFDPSRTEVVMNDDESDSWVSITVYDPANAPEVSALDGETVRGSFTLEVDLWESVDPGYHRSRVTGSALATDHDFSSNEGFRVLRRVELPDRVVDVQYFLAAGTGAAYQDVPYITFDSVRIYETAS
ncbi:MAG: hypothetical protein ACR2P0_16920 [Acidimicrobiales bacterium]